MAKNKLQSKAGAQPDNQSQDEDFDITKCFALHDIALWTTALTRGVEYDPAIHEGRCSVQTFRRVKHTMLTGEAEGADEAVVLLRALVSLGVRSVYKADDASDEEILYTLEATFGVEYFVIKSPPEEQFIEFINFNCVHNAWSFWRQHVFDTLKRASLPVPVVPFFPGRRPVKRAKLGRVEEGDADAAVE